MPPKSEQDTHELIETFTREVMEMGRRYQEAALQLASLRMHAIVFHPDDGHVSRKGHQPEHRKKRNPQKAKPNPCANEESQIGNDPKHMIIDLDPVTYEPTQITYMKPKISEEEDEHGQT